MLVTLSEENNSMAHKIFDDINKLLYESDCIKKLSNQEASDVLWAILKNLVGNYIWITSNKNIITASYDIRNFKEDVEDYLMTMLLSLKNEKEDKEKEQDNSSCLN